MRRLSLVLAAILALALALNIHAVKINYKISEEDYKANEQHYKKMEMTRDTGAISTLFSYKPAEDEADASTAATLAKFSCDNVNYNANYFFAPATKSMVMESGEGITKKVWDQVPSENNYMASTCTPNISPYGPIVPLGEGEIVEVETETMYERTCNGGNCLVNLIRKFGAKHTAMLAKHLTMMTLGNVIVANGAFSFVDPLIWLECILQGANKIHFGDDLVHTFQIAQAMLPNGTVGPLPNWDYRSYQLGAILGDKQFVGAIQRIERGVMQNGIQIKPHRVTQYVTIGSQWFLVRNYTRIGKYPVSDDEDFSKRTFLARNGPNTKQINIDPNMMLIGFIGNYREVNKFVDGVQPFMNGNVKYADPEVIPDALIETTDQNKVDDAFRYGQTERAHVRKFVVRKGPASAFDNPTTRPIGAPATQPTTGV